ncbi:MAG: hypothetical protein LBH45_00190, partial [Campylobacteraceae bacterium]|nr:hypothetical protein [Campylobacteraceae bacterium]
MIDCFLKKGLEKIGKIIGKAGDVEIGGNIKPNDTLPNKSYLVKTKNREKIREFFHNVKTKPFDEVEPAIELGRINDILADKIKEAFGIDIKGFKRVITKDGFIHVKNRHTEINPKDTKPITEDDMLRYEDIVDNPDKIAHTKTPQGLDAIVYQKQYDDAIYIVEEIRSSTRRGKTPLLALKTMFKNDINKWKKYKNENIEWINIENKGYQANNAQALKPEPASYVQNAPDTPSADIIPQN